jgi:uncharacterized membrane protein
MDGLISILIIVHIIAFLTGGSNSVVGPVIERRLATATPDIRDTLFGVMNTLAQVGKVSMVASLVTGPLILYLKYGGLAGAGGWFWLKMVLIVVMLVAIVYGGIQFKRLQGGDASAAERAGLAHRITGLAFFGVIIAAVMAFP